MVQRHVVGMMQTTLEEMVLVRVPPIRMQVPAQAMADLVDQLANEPPIVSKVKILYLAYQLLLTEIEKSANF